MGIIDEDMRRIVDSVRLGFVATICEDRSPNLSPKFGHAQEEAPERAWARTYGIEVTHEP